MRELLHSERQTGLLRAAVHKTAAPLLWFDRVAFYDHDPRRQPVPLTPCHHQIDLVVATRRELMHRHGSTLAGSFGLAPQEVARRLAHAHTGLLALHQGQPVAMAWLAFNVQAVVEIDRTLRLRPGESLSYDEFTLPAWRGLGINPRLNQLADTCAREHAAERRISWRRLCNVPAVRVAEKLGHRQFSVATTVRVMGIDHAWVLGLHARELRRLVRP